MIDPAFVFVGSIAAAVAGGSIALHFRDLVRRGTLRRRDAQQALERAQMGVSLPEGRVPCPECAEAILPAARKCPYCRSAVPPRAWMIPPATPE